MAQPPPLRLVGCREHNLHNLTLEIPKGKLVVVTGVSGSGKSSLAFDTLFSEGQRRFIESLSMSARASIKQLPRPEVDLVEGLSPTLAVGQGALALAPKATVGTQTEIYDLLATLFAQLGQQWSLVSDLPLERFSREEMVEEILKRYSQGTRLQVLAPIVISGEPFSLLLERLRKLGFLRIRLDGIPFDLTESEELPEGAKKLEVVIDRLAIREGVRDRLAESVRQALQVSDHTVGIQEGRDGPIAFLSDRYLCPETGEILEPLKLSDFQFHSPRTACERCAGWGGYESVVRPKELFLSSEPIATQVEELLRYFPVGSRHIAEAAWQAWAAKQQISASTYPQEVEEGLLYGSDQPLTITLPDRSVEGVWKGWIALINHELGYKAGNTRLSGHPGIEWHICPACQGGRLRPQALRVHLQGLTLPDLCHLTIGELHQQVQGWKFEGSAERVARELLPGLLNRLDSLQQLGLDYLTLNRSSETLSAGELQRVELAAKIGLRLSGVLYVLDEPSRGLHRREAGLLRETLIHLCELGNSIVVVEHEPTLIKAADHLIELGPGAGAQGGRLLYQGDLPGILTDPSSVTGRWLSGTLRMPPPPRRKVSDSRLRLHKATCHNLQDLSLDLPLGVLVGFCGVSGSGKSTLLLDVVAQEVSRLLRQGGTSSWLPEGVPQDINRLILIDQRQRSATVRSLPATFIGVMTPLRKLFAQTRLAKARGYDASYFSLNRKGGRCEACEGLGQRRVPIDFLPDLWAPCEVCRGRRFTYEALQVAWQGKTFADLLEATAAEVAPLFSNFPEIGERLSLMCELGLDYVTLGQPFPTLSGGERQRLQLVAELAKRSVEPTLYILDEPSAGLHLQDTEKLIRILQRLVDAGHSVWVIEHQLELLQQCDWLVELGPEGGPKGGRVLFQGPPEQLVGQETPTGLLLI